MLPALDFSGIYAGYSFISGSTSSSFYTCIYKGSFDHSFLLHTHSNPTRKRFIMKIQHSFVLFLLILFASVCTAQVPTITSFAPTSGIIGSTVVLTGTNFNLTPLNNVVYFGATRATVLVASATQISVTVPFGATYQSITVLNTLTGRSCASSRPFITRFSPTLGGISTSDFLPKVDFTVGNGPRAVAVGDLDGDGNPDLVTANTSANTISIRRNIATTGILSSTSLSAKVDFATGTAPISIALGDFDGDGKLDIAVANSTGNTVSVFRNSASSGRITTASFATRVNLTTASQPN